MENKTILDKILNHKKELPDYWYTTDSTTGFYFVKLSTDTHEKSRVLKQNTIIFIIEGGCSLSYEQYKNRMFFAGDILFFPKSAMVTGLVLESTKIVYMTFDMPLNIIDKQYIQQQWEIAKDLKYDFTPLKMNYSMSTFINSLVYLMKNGGSSTELNEIKHRELFLILRLFYTNEQFAEFFYQIIGESFNFRKFVLESYIDCSSLNELIKRSNMCSNIFMQKFKKEFGMSGYQWMLKQMCQRIEHKASEPGVTIKEIMNEVGIKNASHFNRVCKRHFNQTPKQLIDYCQSRFHMQ